MIGGDRLPRSRKRAAQGRIQGMKVRTIVAAVLIAAPFLLGGLRAAAREEPLEIEDLRGARHLIPDPKAKATALIFITHDCPISNAYAPEVGRIAAAYDGKSVACCV